MITPASRSRSAPWPKSSRAQAEAALQEKFDAAAAKNREVVRKLSAAVELPLKAMAVTGAGEADFESNFAPAEFERAVAEGKELIFAGECFQIVLSQRFRRKTKANAVALYRALRATNPSPYMFLLNFGTSPDNGGEQALIGASPEMLVRCRDRELTYRPIAGTRSPRSQCRRGRPPRPQSCWPMRRSAPST